MKLVHNHYHFQELPKLLAERWDRPNLSKADLLKWGAAGRLQFSIYLFPAHTYNAEYIELTQKHIEDDPQNNPDGMVVPCDYKRICYSKDIFKISKETVEKILDNELHQIADRETYEVAVQILPWCKDANCEWSKSCFVGYDMVYDYGGELGTLPDSPSTPSKITCKLSDLIVTRADILYFEENESIREEEKPIYLRETEDGYNRELAIVIETWKALFVDKQCIEEKTAKQAAIKYIESKYPDYEGNTDSGTPFQ